MKDEHVIYLLQVVKNNGNLSPLSSKYSYAHIAQEISCFIQQGYIADDNGFLELSAAGLKYLKQLQRKQEAGYGGFIQPQIEYKITASSIDDIYIPDAKIIKDLE